MAVQKTITITDRMAVGLTYLTEQINAKRAAEDPPKAPLTEEEVVSRELYGVFMNAAHQKFLDAVNDIEQAMRTASPAQLATIRQTLGIT